MEHWLSYSTPLDIPDARRREVDYINLAKAGYDEQRRRSLAQIATMKWPSDGTWNEQLASVKSWIETECVANTSEEAEFEVQVMGPGGIQRVTTRRVTCRVIAAPAPEVGLLEAPPVADATLDTADALAALPGTRAIIAGVLQAAELGKLTVTVALQMLQQMTALQHAEFDRLRRENDDLRKERDRAWSAHSDVAQQLRDVLEALGPQVAQAAPAVAPEVLESGLKEVGQTVKTMAMHWFGVPTELGALISALASTSPEMRQVLTSPKALAALAKPDNAATLAALLNNLPEA